MHRNRQDPSAALRVTGLFLQGAAIGAVRADYGTRPNNAVILSERSESKDLAVYGEVTSFASAGGGRETTAIGRPFGCAQGDRAFLHGSVIGAVRRAVLSRLRRVLTKTLSS